MKPVFQDPTIGECVRCCFATIFDVDKETLPYFGADIPLDHREERDWGNGCKSWVVKGTDIAESDSQYADLHDWLGAMGLATRHISPHVFGEDGAPHEFRSQPWGLCIANGPAARGHHHAVVWDAELPWLDEEHPLARGIWQGGMVHDPHPSGAGLLRVDDFWCFRVKDPAKAIRTTIQDTGQWPRPSKAMVKP